MTSPSGVRPICFMVMPFGIKETGINDGSAPTKVDFDFLWKNAFLPVLAELGYDPVRADSDIDALIIKDMMERLTIADLIIADLSIQNGNVYYEVGIRHAAKEVGCVLVAAEWAKPVFDANQMRRITYPLPTERPEDKIVEIRKKLKEQIPEFAKGRSPVHGSVTGYPGSIDARNADSFKALVKELSSFQGKIHAVAALEAAEKGKRIEALIKEYVPATGQMLFSVAYELLLLVRDHIGWAPTVEYINGLPQQLKDLPLVKEQYNLALSKTGNHANAIGALEAMVKEIGNSSERQGLIGGRYKKLYSQSNETNAKQGYLNRAIAHYTEGMFLDLNDYYCACNLPRLLKQRGTAADKAEAVRIGTQVIFACERAIKINPHDEWIKPTLLGASFDAADLQKAQELAARIAEEGIHAWKLETTIADLELSVTQIENPEIQGQFNEIVAQLKGLLSRQAA